MDERIQPDLTTPFTVWMGTGVAILWAVLIVTTLVMWLWCAGEKLKSDEAHFGLILAVMWIGPMALLVVLIGKQVYDLAAFALGTLKMGGFK